MRFALRSQVAWQSGNETVDECMGVSTECTCNKTQGVYGIFKKSVVTFMFDVSFMILVTRLSISGRAAVSPSILLAAADHTCALLALQNAEISAQELLHNAA